MDPHSHNHTLKNIPMASFTSLLSLTLCLLVLTHSCSAQLQGRTRLQRPRLHARTQCDIQQLTAQEPKRQIESEAGLTQIWEHNDELECAGVQALRRVIQPKGLLLPYYTNAPQLVYIIQGRGIQGTVIPGCAETYETEISGQSERIRHQGGERFVDRHQKVRRFQAGDILALPAGLTHWAYNDGEEQIVSVSIIDTSNHANQLDDQFRKFFLAGNPLEGQQGQRWSEGQRHRGEQGQTHRGEQGQTHRGEQGQTHRGEQGQTHRGQHASGMGNIFRGFDEELLAKAFNVDTETIRNVQGQNDARGGIVRAEKFQVILPQREIEEEERRESGPYNGLEETSCSMRLIHNIGDSKHADVYNPRGGRISRVNSLKLPILNYLQLSAERGILYRNAIRAPYWNTNAHSVIYIIRGNGRIQVVGNRGKSVFDDQVREGQLIVVPQNFAVVKQAGSEGLDWVAFKTHENAMSSQLAGRTSAIRSLPEEVLMNSYDISREEARSLKFNRQEATLFSPRSSRQ